MTSATPSRLPPPPQEALLPVRRPRLVVSVMLATLMQAIDTTIADVALAEMQGELSATQDQAAWIPSS